MRHRLCVFGIVACLAGSTACATVLRGSIGDAQQTKHPYRYSVVDMPVSLAVGSARTPEFAPAEASRERWYWIMIQVEKPLPFDQMVCMMAVTDGTSFASAFHHCTGDDPLLRANWTVSSEGQIVSSGSSSDSADANFTNNNIFKFLGKFPTRPGKKYVVEVTFTKDGTPLDVANPHLIVTKIGDE